MTSNAQYAQAFQTHEIYGLALDSIQEDHLTNTMQITLHDALKIIRKFNDMKSQFASDSAKGNVCSVDKMMIINFHHNLYNCFCPVYGYRDKAVETCIQEIEVK
jgi:hypothetical protein